MSEYAGGSGALFDKRELRALQMISDNVDHIFGEFFPDPDAELTVVQQYKVGDNTALVLLAGFVHAGDVIRQEPDGRDIGVEFAQQVAEYRNDRNIQTAVSDLGVLALHATTQQADEHAPSWRQLTLDDREYYTKIRSTVAHVNDARLTRVEIIDPQQSGTVEGLEIIATNSQLAAGTYTGLWIDDINDIRARRLRGEESVPHQQGDTGRTTPVIPNMVRPSMNRLNSFSSALGRL